MPFNIFSLGAVEVIQGYKKLWVRVFVPHKEVRNIFNEFIDDQTKYTRSAADAGNRAYAALFRLTGRRTFLSEVAEDVYSNCKTK